ncbi:glycoside hydrolase family 3 C-terminal domain-containing protein [Coraliomargarita algicola]|uniref:Glycoside hydrolase family 3 C-terminal domain-containing protein n=2 Tax=Coraliomargarita algicola TaxID=3092156 RepID=A0ABZ0RPS8_9BACT|nr:glycoside hydrolase family 3 N-terminal domain-containing protein [Coraliomargarita sp. J2-16]WPJ98231.1 glycoside hydrolase family 3 C-terminal domain-containing protein [Coraliomargarita sp. J2-16]
MNEVQRWFLEETRLGIPVDFTNEGIRGLAHPYATNFPSQLGLGAAFDRDLVRRVGEITGQEGRALGYTNIYSPILDVVRDPRWGRTEECYGEEPYLVGELGVQQVLGLQSQGVAATVKHYAAYSTPHGGRDGNARTDPQIPFRDMHEILMEPFRKAFMEAHAMGTMSSYNSYNGEPVTGSSYFLNDLLRGEYGFKGYVVSDSGAVTRLHRQHDVAKDFNAATAMAVNAGLNVRTSFKPMSQYVNALRVGLRRGMIEEAVVDARVRDVLRVKFALGLFDAPYVDPQAAPAIVRTQASQAVALEAARKSIVLLKNDNHTLPLDSKRLKTVLVTGPVADDYRALVNRYGPMKSDLVTPLTGLKAYLKDDAEVLYAKGADFTDARFPESDVFKLNPNAAEKKMLDEAIALAQKSDVIIAVVGDDHSTVGEARSRTTLDLPGHQELLVREMVKTGKPVIVVLMGGRAASINWIDRYVPGILAAWHGGEASGTALAEVLFGDYNPGGKLPITFPRSVGQIPMAVPYRSGAWSGQSKKVDPNGFGSTRAVDPLYSFGYGLSYTQFEYGGVKVEPAKPRIEQSITVSCRVKNVGQRAGDEVVQLYVKDVLASIVPFEQVLRGFERVSLKPGESKTVQFTINPMRDLKMMDINNKWGVEPGDFDVRIGASSTDIKQRAQFTLVN